MSERVWEWAKVLLIGAILVPGERTVAAIVRVMGCSNEKPFPNDHRVLTRATWSSRELSRRLLVVLVRLCVPGKKPLVMDIEETIERRRGRTMAARGVSRDPVRSSKEFFVKTHGWRWICLMLLAPIPWASRVWAWPFLTVLAPSERSHEERQMRQNTITDWAWQMILHVARWLPGRQLIIIADGTDAVLDFLLKVSRLANVSVIARLRLDACLYDPAPKREAGKKGRTAPKGRRQPKLEERLHDAQTVWQKHRRSWYGGNHARDGDHHGHSSVVSVSHSFCRDPLGPRSRSQRPRRTPGLAVHGSTGRSAPDRRVVGSALERRSHLS